MDLIPVLLSPTIPIMLLASSVVDMQMNAISMMRLPENRTMLATMLEHRAHDSPHDILVLIC